MFVQIAVSGQYLENYAIHDWDGKGDVPQNWKPKGLSIQPVVCHVKLSDLPSVAADIRERMDDFGFSNDAARFYPEDIMVMPSRLVRGEFVEWRFNAYDEIRSVSQADIQAFLQSFNPKMLREDAPRSPEERFDYLDVM